MVLPAERHDHAVAVHAQLRLVRTRAQRVSGAKPGGQAAKEFGATDDRARLAIAHAGLREGRKVGNWEEAAKVAAAAAGLDAAALLEKARSPAIEARARATTAEFHSLKVNQRPTFVLENRIGDRAVFSGLATAAPLAAAIDAMLDDAAAYAAHAAHFGPPPVG